MLKKSLMIAAGLALGVSSPAMAVTFVGYTQGCFGINCAPEAASGSASDVSGQITYWNSTFNVDDVFGVGAIGDAPTPPLNFNNLGSFTITPGVLEAFGGQEFNLRVVFTQPPGTVPGSTTYEALLSGGVGFQNGALVVNFDNAPQLITYPGGAFTLSVNDLSVVATQGNPATSAVNGQILVDGAVPEPATWGMLLLGFGGIGFAMRRRKAENRTQRVRVAYS